MTPKIILHVRDIASEQQIKNEDGSVFYITTLKTDSDLIQRAIDAGIKFLITDKVKATIPFDPQHPKLVNQSIRDMISKYNLENGTNREVFVVTPSETMSAYWYLNSKIDLDIDLVEPLSTGRQP